MISHNRIIALAAALFTLVGAQVVSSADTVKGRKGVPYHPPPMPFKPMKRGTTDEIKTYYTKLPASVSVKVLPIPKGRNALCIVVQTPAHKELHTALIYCQMRDRWLLAYSRPFAKPCIGLDFAQQKGLGIQVNGTFKIKQKPAPFKRTIEMVFLQ